MHVDLDAVVPLPALKTACGRGFGLAACPALGLLVTSCNDNTLSVFALPSSGAGLGAHVEGLARVCTLGGRSSPAPMQFDFWSGDGFSGYLAFSGPVTSRLLLVTDAGHDAVHVIDVARRVHVGYVAGPGTVAGPRGVAARGSLVAVSAWKEWALGSCEHVVVMFEGSGAAWSVVRVVAGGSGDPGRADGQLKYPSGLRFSGDGTGLAVADCDNGRVSMFRVEDRGFVRHVTTGLSEPYDVEESEGEWLVVCAGSDTIEYVGCGVGQVRLGRWGYGDGEFNAPVALALVPGLGLAVREWGNERLQFFSTPDVIAMASMSAARVAWLVAVARAAARRAALRGRAEEVPPVGASHPSRRKRRAVSAL